MNDSSGKRKEPASEQTKVEQKRVVEGEKRAIGKELNAAEPLISLRLITLK
jgi:hypothetical protein